MRCMRASSYPPVHPSGIRVRFWTLARPRQQTCEESMERRKLLLALAAAPLAFYRICAHAQAKTMKDIETLQKNWKSFLPAGATVPAASEPLKLSKDEWKKRLPPQSYNVMREEGTERAGT